MANNHAGSKSHFNRGTRLLSLSYTGLLWVMLALEVGNAPSCSVDCWGGSWIALQPSPVGPVGLVRRHAGRAVQGTHQGVSKLPDFFLSLAWTPVTNSTGSALNSFLGSESTCTRAQQFRPGCTALQFASSHARQCSTPSCSPARSRSSHPRRGHICTRPHWGPPAKGVEHPQRLQSPACVYFTHHIACAPTFRPSKSLGGWVTCSRSSHPEEFVQGPPSKTVCTVSAFGKATFPYNYP